MTVATEIFKMKSSKSLLRATEIEKMTTMIKIYISNNNNNLPIRPFGYSAFWNLAFWPFGLLEFGLSGYSRLFIIQTFFESLVKIQYFRHEYSSIMYENTQKNAIKSKNLP